MFTSVILFICVVTSAKCAIPKCDEAGTIFAVKKPLYDFSVRFLDKISVKNNHFVYSPLSTWLQVVLLTDGAQNNTLKQMFEVTGLRGYRKKTCYRRKFKDILNKIEDDPALPMKRSSAVIIDKFFKLEHAFKNKAERLHGVKTAALDFDDAENSAIKANNLLKSNSEWTAGPVSLVIPENFDRRVFFMADLAHFNTAWKYPFNEAQTKPEPFYSKSGYELGTVNMMNQAGYFKVAEIALIKSRVLELPFADDRTSLFIYLPVSGSALDIFYNLKRTTLTGVINVLNDTKPKAFNIRVPKFSIETEIVNIAELLFDMGITRAFYPSKAELGRITKSGRINVSLMSQLSVINVTETHVEASVGIAEGLAGDREPADFMANKPFAFMLVDKKLQIILFAGVYSDPNYKPV